MKTLFSICSVAVLLPTLTAAQGSAAPQAATPPAVVTMTMASTIVQQYTSVKDLWIKTADAMPADAYAFRPTPEMRTFSGGMGHVLASNISQCNSLVGRKHALAGADLEKTLTTKADTVKAVAETFAFCDEYFLKIDETTSIADAYVNMTGKGRTGEPVTFKVSNGASIVHFLTHNNEMYGYLAVYLRLKGIGTALVGALDRPGVGERPMSRRTLLGALALAFIAPSLIGAQAVGNQVGRDSIDQAITAQGGEPRLTSLHALALETIGHGFALEQSERPEGPWLTTYTQQSEIRDFDHRRIRLRTERRNWVYHQWSPAIVAVSGEDAGATQFGTRWVPTGPTNFDQALALDPERLLLTARAATDLHALPDEIEQRIAQHVVAFSYQGTHLRLSLNPWTHLPTMLEQVSNRLFGGTTWGDVTVRRWYSFWTLERGGLMYPRQTTTEWNGFPYADQTVQDLTVDGPVDESAFAIPDDVRAASKAAATTPPRPAFLPTIAEDKVIAVSDTVLEIPGGFNVSLVKQPDGLVVIEGTTSPAYSQLVMAYAAKRFPGVPIKALVTTSDAWPHIGGVREYVAAGTPIYALDLNVSILKRVVQAPHTIAPDTLATHPRTPVFRPVTDKTTIGTGDTQIVLVPLRGEIGERMMMAWLPAQHLLYSSDSIQRMSTGAAPFFMPEMLREVQLAAEREHITGIDRVFGMHLTPTPWTEVVAAIDAAMRH